MIFETFSHFVAPPSGRGGGHYQRLDNEPTNAQRSDTAAAAAAPAALVTKQFGLGVVDFVDARCPAPPALILGSNSKKEREMEGVALFSGLPR